MTIDADTTTDSDAETGIGTDVEIDDGPTLVLAVTPEALERVLEIRDAEDDPGTLCLRVAVNGVSGVEYAYDLAFEAVADADPEDDISVQSGLSVVVAFDSVEQMRGSTLDVPRNPGQAGLVIRNPNRPNPLAGREIVLTGDVPDKVRQLLAESINPSLAAHGGFAELVGVEGNAAYLTMGGGCQGCAMSAATLREGIQVAILEAIPEITEVVDVTDHNAGDNPFYS